MHAEKRSKRTGELFCVSQSHVVDEDTGDDNTSDDNKSDDNTSDEDTAATDNGQRVKGGYLFVPNSHSTRWIKRMDDRGGRTYTCTPLLAISLSGEPFGKDMVVLASFSLYGTRWDTSKYENFCDLIMCPPSQHTLLSIELVHGDIILRRLDFLLS